MMSIDQNEIINSMMREVSEINNPIIVDIGAYTGNLALKMCECLSNCKIYCIEACRKNFKVLNNNVKYNDNIFPTYAAISFYDGVTKFYVAKNKKTSMGSSQSNSLYRNFLDSKKWAKVKEKEVKCMTLDTFCIRNNIQKIDCLKINCEGCEFNVFDSPTKNFLDITTILYIEMHGKCREFNSDVFVAKKKKIMNCLLEFNFTMIEGDMDMNTRTHIRQLWIKNQ